MPINIIYTHFVTSTMLIMQFMAYFSLYGCLMYMLFMDSYCARKHVPHNDLQTHKHLYIFRWK